MESFVTVEQGDHPCRSKAMLVDVFVVPDPIFVPRERVQPRSVAVLLYSLPKNLGIVGAVVVVKAYFGEEVVSVPEAGEGVKSLREGFDVEARQGTNIRVGIEIGLRQGEALGEVATAGAGMPPR
jgi:hypothetical protein